VMRAILQITLGAIGVVLIILGIYGIVRGKFGQQTSGGALGGTITVPLSALILILGLGSLGFAGYLSADQSTTYHVAMPAASDNPSSELQIPTSPASPTPTSSSPLTPQITLTCTLGRTQIRPGATIELTYNVNSTTTRQVGLGAGLYDEQGNDHSNGDGDISSFTLKQGSGNPSRPVTIPAKLPPGRYELDAEIWPANQIGQNGINDFVDAACARFAVP
jgi:hypothetical protein